MSSCKGCYKHIFKSCYMRAGFMTFKKESVECPCITCLVKSMCTQVCDNLAKYSVQLYDELHDKWMVGELR